MSVETLRVWVRPNKWGHIKAGNITTRRPKDVENWIEFAPKREVSVQEALEVILQAVTPC